MNDLKWWKMMFILAAACLLIMGIIASIHTSNLKTRNLELIEQNTYFEEQALSSDFAYTAASMEIDNLEQVIQSKDDLILELKVKTEMLPLYKETLRYYITYIRLCQTTMIFNGLDYPEFLYDTILEDEYFEDLEEQVEYFEEIGD